MRFKIGVSSLILCSVFLISKSGFSQTREQSKMDALSDKKDDPALKKARAEYLALRFPAAINFLKPIIVKDSGNVKVQEIMANSYRNIRNYKGALLWYSKLVKNKPLKSDWVLHYAEALANNQHYEQSEQWYRTYLTLVPADKRASSFSKTDPSIFSKDEGEWKVMYSELNTSASEYSPIYYKDGLLFVTNRKIRTLKKNTFGWDQTPYSDFYVVDNLKDIDQTDNNLKEANRQKRSYKLNDDDTEPTSNDNATLGQYNLSLLSNLPFSTPNTYALKGKINSKFHEGPAVILPEGTLMFTRNNYKSGLAQESETGINKLKIYLASGPKWTKIEEFPFNSDEFSTGHPAISKDGNFIVFSSDRPGGLGGSDLYYSVRTGPDSRWGRPVNMGNKVNTEGNELFPYMDKDDKLFFSSTGYAGLGGLDIFEITLKDLKPTYAPRNLGRPFNSPADDFGFIKSDNGRKGYFSSNREGNDDIYAYSKLTYTVTLAGRVVDVKTQLPLGASTVFLRHGGEIDTIQTNSRGQFTVPVEKETEYELIGQKSTYFNSSAVVSTIGITNDTTINVLIKLDHTAPAQQWVIAHCDSLKKVFALQNIYYDLDKVNIRPDSHSALEKVVALMKAHPEVNIISASHTDSRASTEYNKDLSLRRGKSARDYIISKGISPGRITVEYYGKTRLVNQCFDGYPCSEEDQQLNRRTEFEVIINNVNLTQIACEQ